MIVSKKFVSDDQVLEVTFEFTYDESEPQEKLSTAIAEFVVNPAGDSGQRPSPAGSPPPAPDKARIPLKGTANFDFKQQGMEVRGDARLVHLQQTEANGGAWLDVYYGEGDFSHFEGVAVLFDWVLSRKTGNHE